MLLMLFGCDNIYVMLLMLFGCNNVYVMLLMGVWCLYLLISTIYLPSECRRKKKFFYY